MARLHLFEFEDQRWCPAVLRNAVTGYLRLAVQITQQLRPVVPRVAALLRSTGEDSIVDLCSGGGDLPRQLARGLQRQGLTPAILLTDLYPDVEAFRDVAERSGGQIGYRSEPVDAADAARRLPGLRTMFNAFHHFPPAEARRVLAAAAESAHPIAILEFVERSPVTLFGIFFSPILALLLAPWIRPLRWQTLFFTYLVPLVPLMILWDGVVSWLRVYSVRELRALAASVPSPGYAWEAGHWRAGPLRVTYLVGRRP